MGYVLHYCHADELADCDSELFTPHDDEYQVVDEDSCYVDSHHVYHAEEDEDDCSEVVPGDANGDGIVNVVDMVVIIEEILYPFSYVSEYSTNDCTFVSMDANSNGDINVVDVVLFVSEILYG